jgi:hypothetical protein
VLRPRFGRAPKPARRLDRNHAPQVFHLVEQIAAEIDAKPPDHLVLNLDDTVRLERSGVRSRTTLHIGSLQWLSLTPQLQVALLAHELAHTVNGDPLRARFVHPVLTIVGRLGEWTRVDRTLAGVVRGPRRRNPITLLSQLVQWCLSRIVLAVQLAFRAAGFREQHRAEYRADSMCATVAGTAAAFALMDHLLYRGEIDRLLGHVALHSKPLRWRTSVELFLSSRQGAFAVQRQHSIRVASLWDAHPPAGRRAQRLLAAPTRQPRLVLPEQRSAQLAAELPSWISATHHQLLGTREFVERRTPAPRPPLAST